MNKNDFINNNNARFCKDVVQVHFLSEEEEKELNKEAQIFKCVCCDVEAVRWNGLQWECEYCGKLYGKKTEITLP